MKQWDGRDRRESNDDEGESATTLTLEGVNYRIMTHEKVCSVRYANILERTKRIEYVMYAVAGALALALLNLVLQRLA